MLKLHGCGQQVLEPLGAQLVHLPTAGAVRLEEQAAKSCSRCPQVRELELRVLPSLLLLHLLGYKTHICIMMCAEPM